MENFILKIKTVSSGSFKVLFEVLKEVLSRNISIIFTKECMKITELGKDLKVLVHLEIISSGFQEYFCLEDQIIVGIDPIALYKIMKISTSSDTTSFIIEKSSPEKIMIKFEDSSKNKVFVSSLRLLDLPFVNTNIPPFKYDYKVSFKSIDFQNIWKNLNSLGDLNTDIEISKISTQLIFKHVGDFSKQKITYILNDDDQENSCEDNLIIQGIYNIKYLLLFSKSCKINTDLFIYLSNNQPLVLEYGVGDLGFLRFIITQE